MMMDDQFDVLQHLYRKSIEGVDSESSKVIRAKFLTWVYFAGEMQKVVMNYLETTNKRRWFKFWIRPKVDSFGSLIERLYHGATEFLRKRGIDMSEDDFLSKGTFLD